MLAPLKPRYRRVVVLHGLLGMSFEAAGLRVGAGSAMCDCMWRRALALIGGPLARACGAERVPEVVR